MPGKKEISVTFPWPYRTHPTPSPRQTGHPSPHQSRLPLVLHLCSSRCSGHQYLPIAVTLALSAARACPMHGTLHGRPAAPRAATKRTTLMRTTRMRMNAFLQRWLAAAAAAPRRKPGCCSSQGAPLPAVSATLTPMQGCGKCGQAWGSTASRYCLTWGQPSGPACLSSAIRMPDPAPRMGRRGRCSSASSLQPIEA